MRFFFLGHTHTLASMLREALEELYPEDFVSCTVLHPLNTYVEVHAPSEQAVRLALQRIQDKLAAAARIAKAEQVLVVAATLDYEGSKRVVDVEARLFDKTGQPITTISSLSGIKLGKSDNAQLDATRQSILDRIEGSWRNANLIDSNATGYLLVDVPVTSVKQWSDRLAALQQVAVIKNVTIRTLDSDGGSVSLALVGSREALKNALASHDLALVDTGDVISIIAKSDGQ